MFKDRVTYVENFFNKLESGRGVDREGIELVKINIYAMVESFRKIKFLRIILFLAKMFSFGETKKRVRMVVLVFDYWDLIREMLEMLFDDFLKGID